jgi:hypothetical protein
MRDSYEARHSRASLAETLALLGATALIAWPACRGIARRWRVRNPLAQRDSAIDDSLKETFPASDPPATRYVDIPQNRR